MGVKEELFNFQRQNKLNLKVNIHRPRTATMKCKALTPHVYSSRIDKKLCKFSCGLANKGSPNETRPPYVRLGCFLKEQY